MVQTPRAVSRILKKMSRQFVPGSLQDHKETESRVGTYGGDKNYAFRRKKENVPARRRNATGLLSAIAAFESIEGNEPRTVTAPVADTYRPEPDAADILYQHRTAFEREQVTSRRRNGRTVTTIDDALIQSVSSRSKHAVAPEIEATGKSMASSISNRVSKSARSTVSSVKSKIEHDTDVSIDVNESNMDSHVDHTRHEGSVSTANTVTKCHSSPLTNIEEGGTLSHFELLPYNGRIMSGGSHAVKLLELESNDKDETPLHALSSSPSQKVNLPVSRRSLGGAGDDPDHVDALPSSPRTDAPISSRRFNKKPINTATVSTRGLQRRRSMFDMDDEQEETLDGPESNQRRHARHKADKAAAKESQRNQSLQSTHATRSPILVSPVALPIPSIVDTDSPVSPVTLPIPPIEHTNSLVSPVALPIQPIAHTNSPVSPLALPIPPIEHTNSPVSPLALPIPPIEHTTSPVSPVALPIPPIEHTTSPVSPVSLPIHSNLSRLSHLSSSPTEKSAFEVPAASLPAPWLPGAATGEQSNVRSDPPLRFVDESSSNIVYGKMIPTMQREHTRSLQEEVESIDGGGHVSEYSYINEGSTHVRFVISLYVDDIAPTTPAAIVWTFRKGAHVRLSAREPLFLAKRGFYGVVNTACTALNRPYYALNVVRFASFRRIRRVNSPTVQLLFRVHYDDCAVVRSRFDLSVIAEHDGYENVTALGMMRLSLKDSQAAIGERDLSEQGTRSRNLPTLMFTPQIFRSITRPDMAWYNGRSARKLCTQVWSRLGELSASDWDRYTIAKGRFNSEYTRLLVRGNEWELRGARGP